MTRSEQAVDLFARQFNCAQAILAAYGPDEGLAEPDCLRIGAPFGGGIGRLGETCGAVSGALMVLGLRYTPPNCPDPSAKAALYERVRDFVGRFKARNQSILCRELLGCDISTPEGAQLAQDRKLHQTLCVKYVRDAAEILEQM
jgi:C_GCAxxG_C_C family probable redox protein